MCDDVCVCVCVCVYICVQDVHIRMHACESVTHCDELFFCPRVAEDCSSPCSANATCDLASLESSSARYTHTQRERDKREEMTSTSVLASNS